jgi:hypothetical protein
VTSIRSTQVHAMAPDIAKIAKPTMFGGTDPTLTKLGNPWLFRCRPNDTFSGKVIAEFGVKELGLKKWGIVHSTDAFGTNGMKALEASLLALGVTPVAIQGYANQSQDFTPVVLALKQAGIDIISSYFTFENDLGIFARQLRQLPPIGAAEQYQLEVTQPGVLERLKQNANILVRLGTSQAEYIRTRDEIEAARRFPVGLCLQDVVNTIVNDGDVLQTRNAEAGDLAPGKF